LSANRRSVRSGSAVKLSGVLESFAPAPGCVAGQNVALQRRTRGSARYSTFATAATGSDGSFASTIRPTSSRLYRALVTQTASCGGAASEGTQVAVPPVASLVTKTTRLGPSRLIRIQLSCPSGAACSGTLKLRTAKAVRLDTGKKAKVTLDTRSFQIPAGKKRLTKVLVDRKTAEALRTVKSLRMLVFIVGRDTEGNTAQRNASFTLKTS
jgi:hypothetical protein